MLNQVNLVGRLVRDPETKETSNQVPVTTFTLAVGRNYLSKNGEIDTDFFPVVTWRELAEHCGTYLAKGQLVAVSGKLRNRSYVDKDGNNKTITEIVADSVDFLSFKSAQNDKENNNPHQQQNSNQNKPLQKQTVYPNPYNTNGNQQGYSRNNNNRQRYSS